MKNEEVERKNEWLRPAEAVNLLGPIMKASVAQKTICARAHAGLIRARAERFMVDSKVTDECDVPMEFWWAEGGAALEQNWTTGDFHTWIDHRVHWRAFGVSFLRVDIERLVPVEPEKGALAVAPNTLRSVIVLTALNVERRAVLRHLSGIREETVRGTVFHVGRFEGWTVAVAECGEGTRNAALWL